MNYEQSCLSWSRIHLMWNWVDIVLPVFNPILNITSAFTSAPKYMLLGYWRARCFHLLSLFLIGTCALIRKSLLELFNQTSNSFFFVFIRGYKYSARVNQRLYQLLQYFTELCQGLQEEAKPHTFQIFVKITHVSFF